jgi:hypothetical protein
LLGLRTERPDRGSSAVALPRTRNLGGLRFICNGMTSRFNPHPGVPPIAPGKRRTSPSARPPAMRWHRMAGRSPFEIPSETDKNMFKRGG